MLKLSRWHLNGDSDSAWLSAFVCNRSLSPNLLTSNLFTVAQNIGNIQNLVGTPLFISFQGGSTAIMTPCATSATIVIYQK